MPTKPVAKTKSAATPAQFTTWGWSRLKDWEKCPAYAFYKHLKKLKEPESSHLAYGNEVHEVVQRYSVGATKKLPEALTNFKEEAAWLVAHKRQVMVEQQYALDGKWQPTEWFDGDAVKKSKPLPWLRAVLDAVVPEVKQPLPWAKDWKKAVLEKTVIVIDYKTGKFREENQPQLEIYGLTVFAVFPQAQLVDAGFWYLDQGELDRKVFRREDLPKLQKAWLKRVTPMLNDKQFRPNPGRHCTWCAYRKSNNGPCKY
jgi:CRISPR/Cas system-associated exonuclease Cas4 (RecB family)